MRDEFGPKDMLGQCRTNPLGPMSASGLTGPGYWTNMQLAQHHKLVPSWSRQTPCEAVKW